MCPPEMGDLMDSNSTHCQRQNHNNYNSHQKTGLEWVIHSANTGDNDATNEFEQYFQGYVTPVREETSPRNQTDHTPWTHNKSFI